MTEVDNLRKRVRAADERIAELETESERLEEQLHEAVRQAKASDATLQRVKNNVKMLEDKAKRAQDGERKALMQVVELQRALDASGSGAAAASPAKPASPTGTQPSLSQADVDAINAERAAQDTWQRTAQCVVASYKQRLTDEREEGEQYLQLMLTHQAHLRRFISDFKHRGDRMEHTSQIAARVNHDDDDRRMSQFRELTELRERMLMADREKTVLDQELAKVDKALARAEEELRQVNRENRELVAQNDELKRQNNNLSSTIADMSTISDMTKDRSKITSHSELRAETVRLQSALEQSNSERDHLKEQLRRNKNKFRGMEEELSDLYRQGIHAREAMMSELTTQRQNASVHTGDEVERARRDAEAHQWKLMQRVAELEALLNHKNHSLALAEQRLQTSELYAPSQPRSTSAHSSYSRGMQQPRGSSPPRPAFR